MSTVEDEPDGPAIIICDWEAGCTEASVYEVLDPEDDLLRHLCRQHFIELLDG